MYFPPVSRFRLLILEKLKAEIAHEWMYGIGVVTKVISRVAYLSTSTTLMTGMVWRHMLLAVVAKDVHCCLADILIFDLTL